MGILNGGVQSLFGTVFGAFYLDATLTKIALTYDDEGGTTEAAQTFAVKVQENMVSEQTRAAGGFSQDEKQFIVLQSGVGTKLDGDCVLTIDGEHYALRNPEQDPAKSYWLVRGVLRDAPPVPPAPPDPEPEP